MEHNVFEIHECLRGEIPIIFNQQRAYTPGRTTFMAGNWHPNIELLYFLSGEGQVFCNGSDHAVRQGDLIIVNSNELHDLRSEHGMEYHVMIIDSAFLKANGFSVENIQFTSLIRSETVTHLFHAVSEEFEGNAPYRSTAIRAAVLELVVYLARFAVTDAKRPSGEHVKHVIGYIRANFAGEVTLEKAAADVGLDKSYLAREFKKATGMTVISYLNLIRCENARKLLSQNNCTVHEAALRSGFENGSYFARTFRRIVGCLPSEFVNCKEN